MANVLHRTTKQYIRSVNEPDYSLVNWIHDPDLSSVIGFASKHWVITGDIVTLMALAERDAVDVAELIGLRDSTVDSEIDNLEGIVRAFAQVMRDEINILRAYHGLNDRTLAQLKTAIRNKVGS